MLFLTSLEDKRVELFSSLTEAQLCDRRLFAEDLFIAETSKVICTALDAGCEPVSVLTEEKHVEGIVAAQVVKRVGDIPVYVGSRELLQNLTGFPLTRSVLCAVRRPDRNRGYQASSRKVC